MDPCGAFCDLIRRPYTTKCRFFRDSPIEIDISWYPCKPDAPAIDTPSVISSLDWWVEERPLGVYFAYPVGEVPEAPRRFNGLKVKPKADGKHRCGTEDEWANGAVFDPTVNRVRRADGLPICCGGVPPGVVIGGRSMIPVSNPGVVIGGKSVVIDHLMGVVISGHDAPPFPSHSYVVTTTDPEEGLTLVSVLPVTLGTLWETNTSGQDSKLESTAPRGTLADWTYTDRETGSVYTFSGWDGLGMDSHTMTHVSGPDLGTVGLSFGD